MSLLDPRMMIETVLPGLAIPVIFVHLLAPVWIWTIKHVNLVYSKQTQDIKIEIKIRIYSVADPDPLVIGMDPDPYIIKQK